MILAFLIGMAVGVVVMFALALYVIRREARRPWWRS